MENNIIEIDDDYDCNENDSSEFNELQNFMEQQNN